MHYIVLLNCFYMKPSILILKSSIAALFFASSLPSSAQSVGIGTTIPQERLHVIHTGDVNKNAVYGFANQTSGSTDFQNTGVAGFGQGNGAPGGFGYGLA